MKSRNLARIIHSARATCSPGPEVLVVIWGHNYQCAFTIDTYFFHSEVATGCDADKGTLSKYRLLMCL